MHRTVDDYNITINNSIITVDGKVVGELEFTQFKVGIKMHLYAVDLPLSEIGANYKHLFLKIAEFQSAYEHRNGIFERKRELFAMQYCVVQWEFIANIIQLRSIENVSNYIAVHELKEIAFDMIVNDYDLMPKLHKYFGKTCVKHLCFACEVYKERDGKQSCTLCKMLNLWQTHIEKKKESIYAICEWEQSPYEQCRRLLSKRFNYDAEFFALLIAEEANAIVEKLKRSLKRIRT